MGKYFNSKVRKKNLKIGDLVIKKIFIAYKKMSSSSHGQNGKYHI